MKKRIAMALSVCLTVLMLGACGTDPEDVDYNGYSYSELKSQTMNCCMIAEVLGMGLEQRGYTRESFKREEDRAQLAAQNGLTEIQLESGFRMQELIWELGDFLGADEDSFSIDKAGNTLTTNVRLKFEKRDVDFQVVYTYYNMKISGITMEPVYSMAEKLGKAGINTLISVLIVFSVLILISLIIACFNVFPYLEKRRAEKKAAAQNGLEPVERVMSQIETREAQEEQRMTDDTELVAVIAAAIAAATGSSTSNFVVRSINRRK